MGRAAIGRDDGRARELLTSGELRAQFRSDIHRALAIQAAAIITINSLVYIAAVVVLPPLVG